ncbi:hypothetical protein F4806DRAFT_496843 [Annulohypoxylon nitens]|nr:hypothetical protein F4806DRAFT_496843 [Annulohypoxylon nitens]
MASINDLPVELLIQITDYLSRSGLAAFCVTNRRHHAVVMNDNMLVNRADPDRRRLGIFMGALGGHVKSVKLLLDTGLSPNFYLKGPISPNVPLRIDCLSDAGEKLSLGLDQQHLISSTRDFNSRIWRRWAWSDLSQISSPND